MKLLDLGAWVVERNQKISWKLVVNHWPLTEPVTILFEWMGLYFLARKAVVANAMDVLAQQEKTAQAKSPLPEPSFALCDLLAVPYPLGGMMADELCQ